VYSACAIMKRLENAPEKFLEFIFCHINTYNMQSPHIFFYNSQKTVILEYLLSCKPTSALLLYKLFSFCEEFSWYTEHMVYMLFSSFFRLQEKEEALTESIRHLEILIESLVSYCKLLNAC